MCQRYRSYMFVLLFLLCLGNCAVQIPVSFGYSTGDDMVASAAEPRSVFIDALKHPVLQPLPLVQSPPNLVQAVGDASEKVVLIHPPKTLQKPLMFSYTDQKPAASKDKLLIENNEENDDVFLDISDAIANYKDTVLSPKSEEVAEETLKQDSSASGSEHGHGDHSGGHGGGHRGKSQGGGKQGPKDESFEKGGGKHQKSDQHETHGEKGNKEFESKHEHEKSEQKKHDKEGHSGKYGEKGGSSKKSHHDEEGESDYKKGEKGEKGAHFEEKGSHNKGHSTKGTHSIHKNDEFEKKHEFYEEFHDSGESEKQGGFKFEDGYDKGSHSKGGHKKGSSHEDHYGKEGKSAKGSHYDDSKGHKVAAGKDSYHEENEKHKSSEGKSDGKKWGYKEGSRDHGKSQGGGHSKYSDHEGEHSQHRKIQKSPGNKFGKGDETENYEAAADYDTYENPNMYKNKKSKHDSSLYSKYEDAHDASHSIKDVLPKFTYKRPKFIGHANFFADDESNSKQNINKFNESKEDYTAEIDTEGTNDKEDFPKVDYNSEKSHISRLDKEDFTYSDNAAKKEILNRDPETSISSKDLSSAEVNHEEYNGHNHTDDEHIVGPNIGENIKNYKKIHGGENDNEQIVEYGEGRSIGKSMKIQISNGKSVDTVE